MPDGQANEEQDIPTLYQQQTTSFNQLLQLKNAEKQLIEKLNKDDLDETTKTNLLSQINQLSTMKRTVYQSIYSMPIEDGSGADISNIDNAVNDMVQRTTQQLAEAEDLKNNAIRSGEITDYYKKSYAAYLKIMYIVCGGLAIIFVMRLFNYVIPIIPDILQSIIVVAVLAGIIIWVFLEAKDITRRDNRFYDKYDFGASVQTVNKDSGAKSDSTFDMNKYISKTYNSGVCVGDACCPDGTTYDSSNNICQLLDGGNGFETFATMMGGGLSPADMKESFGLLEGDIGGGNILDLTPVNSNIDIIMANSASHSKSAQLNRITGPIEYEGKKSSLNMREFA